MAATKTKAKKKSQKKVKLLPWRDAVRVKMHSVAFDEARRRTKSDKPAFAYRWEHVQAVVAVALKLAAATGADAEVVEAAAWLHDVAKEAKDRHPQEGAKFARKFLPKTDFPAKKVEAVAIAIEDHMGLWREKPLKVLESQVLWDADKLTKIGLTAAMHWIGGSLANGKPHDTEKIIAMLQAPDWRQKTVASMHTKPAKKAAKVRLKALDALIVGLSAEWTASDIETPSKKNKSK